MPVFFEMHSTAEPLMRRRNADALAEILQDSLQPFDVRVVSIRKTPSHGFVYGCAARHPPMPGALRAAPARRPAAHEVQIQRRKRHVGRTVRLGVSRATAALRATG